VRRWGRWPARWDRRGGGGGGRGGRGGGGGGGGGVVGCGVADDLLRHQERIGAVPGGDRKNGVVNAQVACLPCPFGPSHRFKAVKAVDIHHPEPHPAVGVKLVDGLLDLLDLRAAQHLRGVGDIAGQPERRCAARGRRQQHPGGQDRKEQAEQAGDAHARQCSDSASGSRTSRRNAFIGLRRADALR
jgi:hypothetical protein